MERDQHRGRSNDRPRDRHRDRPYHSPKSPHEPTCISYFLTSLSHFIKRLRKEAESNNAFACKIFLSELLQVHQELDSLVQKRYDGSEIELADYLVGDEYGYITLHTKGGKYKVGDVVTIRNGHVREVLGNRRIEIDKWAKIEPFKKESPHNGHLGVPKKVNDEINLSEIQVKVPSEYTTCRDLNPGSRVNMHVKVAKVSELREREGRNGKIKEVDCVVGDEYGCLNMVARNEQLEVVKQDAVITIINGHAKVWKEHIRLEVNKFGKIMPSQEKVENVNLAKNLSDTEYELVTVN